MKPNKWRALDENGQLVIGYPYCVPYIKHTTHEEPPIYRNEVVEQWYMCISEIDDNRVAVSGCGVTIYTPKNVRIIKESLSEITKEL